MFSLVQQEMDEHERSSGVPNLVVVLEAFPPTSVACRPPSCGLNIYLNPQ